MSNIIHIFIVVALSIPVYALCTYRSKKTEERLRSAKKSMTQAQLNIGKLFMYAHIACIMLCGFYSLQPYQGTSHLFLFLKDFSISCTKFALTIEFILFVLVAAKVTTYRAAADAAAIQLKCSPQFITLIRVFGPLLCLASALAYLFS